MKKVKEGGIPSQDYSFDHIPLVTKSWYTSPNDMVEESN